MQSQGYRSEPRGATAKHEPIRTPKPANGRKVDIPKESLSKGVPNYPQAAKEGPLSSGAIAGRRTKVPQTAKTVQKEASASDENKKPGSQAPVANRQHNATPVPIRQLQTPAALVFCPVLS